MRPLEGITVATLEHAVAAPFATRQLADLGARVIKIERPLVGDFAREYDKRVNGMASYFAWLNRSKESLTLDIKKPEASRILDQLIARSDVFIQNLGPGAAARLGLSVKALQPKYPSLIICDISGYGQDGPYRNKKAYDLLIQAEAGLMSITGTANEPSRAGISVADIAAGMYAYSHTLAALIQRGRTGKGSHIELSMLESLAEWMSNPMYYAYKDCLPPVRSGASHPSIYPYGPFATGDGKSVLFGIQNEREWREFCIVVLGQVELVDDGRFVSNSQRNTNRRELKIIIEKAFSTLNTVQAIELLERARIGNAEVNSMNDLWNHPQLAARARWREIKTPVGNIPAMLPPGVSDAFDYRMDPIPSLGQHTNPILEELGYSPNEIEQMRKAGVI